MPRNGQNTRVHFSPTPDVQTIPRYSSESVDHAYIEWQNTCRDRNELSAQIDRDYYEDQEHQDLGDQDQTRGTVERGCGGCCTVM